ncbi:hypothetical protein WMY93_005032 [Mugilogobius chulae]|uniref:Metallo-beta-lactamase domain-containing protein n=1 Tax=Mugilogobius chulae TaxID=88201 RepID=A0AAW0Q0Y1_9GOBI
MSAADWYAHKSLGDGLFWIQERFYQSDNRANIWLLRGTHQDVVIDTGLGLRSLPDYIDSKGLLGKDPQRKNPLLAIATHAHFDHSGACTSSNRWASTAQSDREIAEAPCPGWRARNYKVKAVQPTHILQEGDVINLGDRQLTVLHMPGHSRGSICLHDRDNKLLFSGDVVYDGAMIDWLPYSHVSDYISSCERLVGLVDSEQVDQVLPGHYNAFGAKRLHRIATGYISRAETCPAKFSTFAWRTLAGVALRAFNPRSAC